ncbi:MAG: glycosyl hydrolase family 28-related protein [Rhodopila sp.]|jgi:hypothetical protein
MSGFAPYQILTAAELNASLAAANAVTATERARALAAEALLAPPTLTATGSTTPRTLADRFADIGNLRDWGVVGDGVTDNYAAIQGGINEMAAGGGGIVYLPPAGNAYLISHGLTIPAGVRLLGAGTCDMLGFNQTPASWAVKGSWLLSIDLVNPTVTLAASGGVIEGINFVRNQVVPTTGTYSPTTFPYEILMAGDYCGIENVQMQGGTHGINIDFGPSGGGVGCYVRNAQIGTLVRGLRTDNANDVIRLDNIHVRTLWYILNTSLLAFLNTALVGWDCHYTDNPIVNGFEVLFGSQAIFFTDGTCGGITHSLYNGAIDGFQFNLSAVLMEVAASTTTVRAKFANSTMQTPSGVVDHALILTSDNIDILFANTKVNGCNTVFMDLGAGVGGVVHFTGLDLVWNNAGLGVSAFSLAAGSTLVMSGTRLAPLGNPGPVWTGAGSDTVMTDKYGCFQPFVSIAAVATFTGISANQDVTLDCPTNPILRGATQGRLRGSVYIATPQTGGLLAFQLDSFNEIYVGHIAAAAVGWQNFDSGWINFTSAANPLGRVRGNANTGVVYSFGALAVEYR